MSDDITNTIFNSENVRILLCGNGIEVKSCFMLLSTNAQVLLHGVAHVVHLYGPNINIMGANLSSNLIEKYTIYSSSSYSCISISHYNCSLDNNGSPIELNNSTLTKVLENFVDTHFLSSICDKILNECRTFDKFASILMFLPFKSRIINSLREIRKFKHLFYVPDKNCLIENSEIVDNLKFNFEEHDGLSGYKISNNMLSSIERISEIQISQIKVSNSCISLICGPKGVGKSSFLRFSINRLLTHHLYSCVAVLDCDLGQPEFTVPGNVSLSVVRRPLFGPPFTHHFFDAVVIIRQCFVGCITPSDNPKFYLECLSYVFESYSALPEPKPPLLVNTMGWTHGLGLTLLLEQIRLTRPQLIIQLEYEREYSSARLNLSKLDSDTLSHIQPWNNCYIPEEVFGHEIIIITSVSRTQNNNLVHNRCQLGPSDHRDLNILTYFMRTLENAPTSIPFRSKTDSLDHPISHLLDCVPFSISLVSQKLTDAFLVNKFLNCDYESDNALVNKPQNESNSEEFQLAVRILHAKSNLFRNTKHQLPENVDTILTCLNGTLVALCSVPSELIEKPSKYCPYYSISKNPVCECVGYAFCRAIDQQKGLIFLTTGIPTHDLSKVTGLLRGNVNLPNFFSLEQPKCVDHYSNHLIELPYLGPADTQGTGRAGLPIKRSYPRTNHHDVHRTGTSESFH